METEDHNRKLSNSTQDRHPVSGGAKGLTQPGELLSLSTDHMLRMLLLSDKINMALLDFALRTHLKTLKNDSLANFFFKYSTGF